MPTIQRIEVIPYRLPLQGALAWGKHSRLEAAEHALVRVHLSDGVAGTAEAPPRPTIYGETIGGMRGILTHLSSMLAGLEIDDAKAIRQVIGTVPNNNVARGALDMAVWEARAKTSGSSLFETLRGPQRRLRVSYILGISDPATMLEEARRVRDSGVRVLKVKVGRDHARDLEVIRQLRAELPDVDLYADSNETLEVAGAASALEAMRAAGLMYVEEPLPVRQIRARAALKRESILPIIADDSCFTRADLERELDFDTFDILNVKTARNGFTESLEMIGLARQAGKGVMIGSQASTTLGTVHAALISSRDGVTHPCELSFFLKLGAEIVSRVPRLEDGFLEMSELDGIEIDTDKLETHRIEG